MGNTRRNSVGRAGLSGCSVPGGARGARYKTNVCPEVARRVESWRRGRRGGYSLEEVTNRTGGEWGHAPANRRKEAVL